MADGFLEKHHEEYERRKADWLRKPKCLRRTNIRCKPKGTIERPENEAL